MEKKHIAAEQPLHNDDEVVMTAMQSDDGDKDMPETKEDTLSDPKSQQTKRSTEQASLKTELLSFLLKLVLVAVLCWAVFSFVFGISVVRGEAMYPRMRDGDLIMFYRLDKDYDIGDVLAYRVDGKRYFGRVVARSGDIVDMSESGQLLINGNIQPEEIFYETYKPKDSTAYPVNVPEGSVYVLCDFRTESMEDSRTFGALNSKDDTDGTVISFLRRRGI